MTRRSRSSFRNSVIIFISYGILLSACANTGQNDYGIRNAAFTEQDAYELEIDLIATGLLDVTFVDEATRRRQLPEPASLWYSEQQEIVGSAFIVRLPSQMPMSLSSLSLMRVAESCANDTATMMIERLVGYNDQEFYRIMAICVPEGEEEGLYFDYIIYDDEGLTRILANWSFPRNKDRVRKINSELLEILGEGVREPNPSPKEGIVS